MRRLTKKILCTLLTLTLCASLFTGCSSGESDTQWFLDKRISLKEKYGALPAEGTVGNMDYRILEKGSYNCNETQKGYYVDMLEEENSPYFIVVTSGSKSESGMEIVDFGMDGSTLQILVAYTELSEEEKDSKSSACCVLELDRMPGDIVIHDKNGATYNLIED